MTQENPSNLDDLSGLTSDSELPYLSNTIVYERDIQPYRFIEIFSGVGSGKNNFINRFVNGDAEKKIPKKIVLVITSRRSKVNELHADKEASYAAKIGRWGNLDIYDEDNFEKFRDNIITITTDWGDFPFYQQSVACTGAFVEKYIQNVYDVSDPGTHLWNLFDMIVVDEFHSLVMDAGYQNAPHYVNSLLHEIAYRHHMADQKEAGLVEDPDNRIIRPNCERVILMTGTPETVKRLPIPYETPHTLDLMDVCVNVVPKNIWLVDKKQTKNLIDQKIANNQRCILMVNHMTMPDEFCIGTSISPDCVAVSFSKEEIRKTIAKCAKRLEDGAKDLKPEEQKMAQIYRNMVNVEQQLAEDGTIPEKFKLWISTSRNKEGINIKDLDINDVFLEFHNISDIKQAAGRVRHGAENLYIIVDSQEHSKKGYRHEDTLDFDEMAPDVRNIIKGICTPEYGALNRHLKKMCRQYGIDDFFANRYSEFRPYKDECKVIQECIDHVHEMYSYVRFDSFRNHFTYYYLKEEANRYHRRQRRMFHEASEDPEKYVKIFQKVFPTAVIHPYKDRSAQMLTYVEQILDGDPNREFTREEVYKHMADLNKICFDSPEKHLNQPNRILKLIGYKVRQVCNDSNKPGYLRWRYHRIEPQKQAS